jgi:hypothetical protein
MWCKYDLGGTCSNTEGPPDSGDAVRIRGSVGKGGQNNATDVITIQRALNQIPGQQGGPSPNLSVDGKCGQLTIAAIGRFQNIQFNGTIWDCLVDTNKKTLARLNDLLGRGSSAMMVAGSSSGSTGVGASGGSTTPDQLDLARSLAKDAERRINQAVQRLQSAEAARLKSNRTAADQQLVREIDWHFKVSAAADPASQVRRIREIYMFMLSAVRESNAGHRELFRAGVHSDPTAIAFAAYGGFFSTIERDRFVFITPIFRTASSGVIIHELAHFCGGNETSGRDIVHRASPKPPPRGTVQKEGVSDYASQIPFHALTNVYSYQVYCFPEIPEFAVP